MVVLGRVDTNTKDIFVWKWFIKKKKKKSVIRLRKMYQRFVRAAIVAAAAFSSQTRQAGTRSDKMKQDKTGIMRYYIIQKDR